MSRQQNDEFGGDCWVAPGLLQHIEREVSIVDMLADEIASILRSIYEPPFRIVTSYVESEKTGGHWGIEVRCDSWWSHPNAEETDDRYGRVVVAASGLFIGGPGNSVDHPNFTIEHPRMMELFLPRFHNTVTNLMEGRTRSMQTATSLCRSVSYNNRIKLLWEATVLMDRRYLRHMYNSGYAGYTTPPDIAAVGDNEQRVHNLRDWDEDADLSWRERDETRCLDKIGQQTSAATRSVANHITRFLGGP